MSDQAWIGAKFHPSAYMTSSGRTENDVIVWSCLKAAGRKVMNGDGGTVEVGLLTAFCRELDPLQVDLDAVRLEAVR